MRPARTRWNVSAPHYTAHKKADIIIQARSPAHAARSIYQSQTCLSGTTRRTNWSLLIIRVGPFCLLHLFLSFKGHFTSRRWGREVESNLAGTGNATGWGRIRAMHHLAAFRAVKVTGHFSYRLQITPAWPPRQRRGSGEAAEEKQFFLSLIGPVKV